MAKKVKRWVVCQAFVSHRFGLDVEDLAKDRIGAQFGQAPVIKGSNPTVFFDKTDEVKTCLVIKFLSSFQNADLSMRC